MTLNDFLRQGMNVSDFLRQGDDCVWFSEAVG